MWWIIAIAIVIVVVWAGWYITAFVLDRNRSKDVVNEAERLDVHPKGPTSTPREQQHRPEGRPGERPEDH
jgi:hypothetical protein